MRHAINILTAKSWNLNGWNQHKIARAAKCRGNWLHRGHTIYAMHLRIL